MSTDDLVVDTEFRGRSIQVRRTNEPGIVLVPEGDREVLRHIPGVVYYNCYDSGRLVQESKPAEAVMGWLANMMMNA